MLQNMIIATGGGGKSVKTGTYTSNAMAQEITIDTGLSHISEINFVFWSNTSSQQVFGYKEGKYYGNGYWLASGAAGGTAGGYNSTSYPSLNGYCPIITNITDGVIKIKAANNNADWHAGTGYWTAIG